MKYRGWNKLKRESLILRHMPQNPTLQILEIIYDGDSDYPKP